MADNEAKGRAFLEQGDKKINSRSFFSFLEDKTQKFQDAQELYSQAANFFKIAKNSELAAEAYVKAADASLKANSKYDAASHYANAARCIRKTDPQRALQCLKDCATLFSEEGRFSMAAKMYKEAAELFESEGDKENAMDFYQSAADIYESEGSTATANGCSLKVAQFAASLEKYSKAVEIFEQVAFSSLDSKLGQYKSKEFFLNAGICHCLLDLVGAKRALEKYLEKDVKFMDSNECKLLTKILAALEAYDSEAFTVAVQEFDSINRLDAWRTSLLNRIKNTIKEEEEKDDSDDHEEGKSLL